MIDRINDFFILKIITYLGTYKKSEETQQKIKYILSVILGEIEKFILLLMIFILCGRGMEYLVVMTTIGSIRSFLGGGHRKTTEGCIAFSFTIIAIVLTISNYCNMIGRLKEGVYLIIIILLIKRAPVITNGGINYTYKKRIEFKFKGMTVLMILSRIIDNVPKEWGDLMVASLLVQGIEVGIESIKKKVR